MDHLATNEICQEIIVVDSPWRLTSDRMESLFARRIEDCKVGGQGSREELFPRPNSQSELLSIGAIRMSQEVQQQVDEEKERCHLETPRWLLFNLDDRRRMLWRRVDVYILSLRPSSCMREIEMV